MGLAIRFAAQGVVTQSLVAALGASEARAQLWEAKARDLADQLQKLQQQKPPGK
jgi:hypothetical protein